MPNLISTFIAAATLVASASVACAQHAAPAPARPGATAASPAAPAASAAPATSYPAEGLEALRAHVGEEVDITGTPTTTGHSKTGTVAYLNFAGAHKAVAVVAFLGGGKGAGTDAAKKVNSEDDLKAFVGKPVIVHGKLADYKGDLQIVLESLDQIKLAP